MGIEQPQQLYGSIERITYHNDENGFCVVKVRARGHKDLVTVVGNALHIGAGEHVEAHGIWVNTASYGVQFKAESLKTVQPTTAEGVEKYLASGMVRGIGPHFARQLVRAFGIQIFDIIDNTPKLLLKLPGIGEKRLKMILESWREQKSIRSIMVFLQAHGVGAARAVRIYKTYGDAAIDKVRQNPYCLAADVYGIGFKTADILAQRLGIAADSMIRARAGVTYALQEISNNGHCAALLDNLITTAAELLEINKEIIATAVTEELKTESIIAEESNAHGTMIYLASLYGAEVAVARNLARLRNGGALPWGTIDTEKAIPWVEALTHLTLSPSQKKAVQQALRNKVSVITGGPGVGKTTIVNSIIKIVKAKRMHVLLCAPTGRAAKRLSETTRLEAKTIHRLLRFDPQGHTFTYHANNQLHVDFVIVDEASMIDIVLMQYLLRAIPDHAALLIVGDVDQLPSVGPGAVLNDIIDSQTINTAKLTEIFRQAANSRIIINAHRINQGQYPLYDKEQNINTNTDPNTNANADTSTVANASAATNANTDSSAKANTNIGADINTSSSSSKSKPQSDFYFIPGNTPEEIQEKLLHVVTQRIPKTFGFNPLRDIQVLAPMNRGGLGSRSLNILLQDKLNHQATPKINKFGWGFAPRDKVMQNVNNYDKDVFNGDIGTITDIDLETSCVKINFDGRLVEYDFNDLDELSLAYATSIHKSQGSEYPVVVIPLAMQHYMMLARNLIYTAVTRGKKLVVIIGQTKALAIAINNDKTIKRLTNLKTRLQQLMPI
jgi:exodeoxyribonuclease V alpha subunit